MMPSNMVACRLIEFSEGCGARCAVYEGEWEWGTKANNFWEMKSGGGIMCDRLGFRVHA